MRPRRSVVALVVALAALAGCAGSGAHSRRGGGAIERFLSGYVEPDGRVVRHDQGGDTVSEGQSYALLLTAATGRGAQFARVWGWTRSHLQRPDGLLAWRWAGGRVVGRQPATDADLDAARALLVAAKRFHKPAYRAAALHIGRGILASETTRVGGKLVLVAGPWARAHAIVNPSYFAPRTLALLGAASGDPRWGDLIRSGLAIAGSLQGHASGLGPDWARAVPGGAVAIGLPADPGAQARYGYDALRVPLRLAEACSGPARTQAAAPWRTLRGAADSGRVAPVYDLGGTPLGEGEHPAALAGAAAAAAAAGDGAAAQRLLVGALRLAQRQPSYYGAAWAALGSVMLRSQRLLGCPLAR
jgi:endoglucanase